MVEKCDFCKAGGEAAPNFHYKPTDLKLWWYKYIGRSMEANRKPTEDEWKAIFSECMVSIKAV